MTMRKLTGRFQRPPILAANTPKGPWGGSGEDPDGGPRNPWAVPPGGRKAPGKPTALDEFIRKARGSGGGPGEGPGGSGSGFGGLPGAPGGRTLWAIGAAILIVVWLLYTSIHPIGPQQRGVVTYFGRYTGILDPGIQITAPAPFANVRVLDVQKIRTENFPEGSGQNLVLTNDQNIIDLTYSVRWDIANPADYAFRLAQPQQTVRAAAESAMRAVIADTSLDQALGSGRTGIEQRVQELTQSILNEYRSGVRIQGVAIKQAAPPQQIVDDFNKVTVAQQRAVARGQECNLPGDGINRALVALRGGTRRSRNGGFTRHAAHPSSTSPSDRREKIAVRGAASAVVSNTSLAIARRRVRQSIR